MHVIALGKTRSAKSSKLRVLVEHILAEGRHPVIIIDPKGDWWGLKVSADGRGAGFPLVIFGGDHADVPISGSSGGHIAELLCSGNRSAILDVSGLTISERTKFFIDFASNLFRHSKGTRYIVPDEVHNFAPKGKIFDVEAGKCLHWANRLASEGQGKGIILLAASQRPQKVHNDFLTSCETLIACKVIHKSDRDAIKDWVDGCADAAAGKAVVSGVAQLKKPEAWVWSPEIGFGPQLVRWPMFKTFDSFKQQDPGDVPPTGWASVDLEDVKARLADVVKEAAENDPRVLRARIAELERGTRGVVDRSTLEHIEQRREDAWRNGLEQGMREGRAAGLAEGRAQGEAAMVARLQGVFRDYVENVNKVFAGIHAVVPRAVLPPELPTPASPESIVARPFVRAAQEDLNRSRANMLQTASNGLKPVEQRILNALAELELLNSKSPKREIVAFMANYSNIKSTGFAKALSALSSAGLVEYPTPDTVKLSFKGCDLAQTGSEPTSAEELQERVINLLEPVCGRILQPLIKVYPQALARTDAATCAGYSNTKSTGFAKALSKLSSLGFVQYPDPATVRASPVLFLEAG